MRVSVPPDRALVQASRDDLAACADVLLENVFTHTPEGAHPDGATVDAEGYLWSAHWGAGQIVRYRPDGTVDRSLPVPASQPTCVAFGGADLDWLVPHQANRRIIEATAERMGLPMDKVMVTIQKYGNTTAATIPLCLWDYEARLKPGDRMIFAAFGAGFAWGGAYLTWAYDGAAAARGAGVVAHASCQASKS